MNNTPLGWYCSIPIVTRVYMTACVIISSLTALEVLSPLSLYFNPTKIADGQMYRLVTPFLYFGNFSIDFLFHMYFSIRYLRILEESSFSNRTIDFLWLLLYGVLSILLIAPFLDNIFLGHALTFMIVYIWGRKNPHMRMSFLGLFQFNAPYLPLVLFTFSWFMGQRPVLDLVGVLVGHIYFFMDEIFPQLADIRKWNKVNYLRTPEFVKTLFGLNNIRNNVDVDVIVE